MDVVKDHRKKKKKKKILLCSKIMAFMIARLNTVMDVYKVLVH